jgi:uncharacterized protein (DUF2141 family)
MKTKSSHIASASSKLTCILALLLFSCASAYAAQQLDIRPYEASDECDTQVMQIRVTVNGVSFGGILTVGLYDDPDHFLFKQGRKQRIRVPATDEQHTVCFNLDKHGTYAVAAFHDIDANRKLKRRWNLLPGEPFGLSNNPEQFMGLPKFNDSAFTTERMGADISIDLVQP